MTIHHSFDRQSRRYLGQCPIPASILDPVKGSAAPANSLAFEPPTPSANETVLVNEAFDNWELVPDFTGTVYQKADGQPVEHKELGALPDTLTPQQPSSQYDEWNEASNSWIKNKTAEKDALCSAALEALKQERNHHRQHGFSYQSHQVEATAIDQGNIVAVITGYTEGIRTENTPVYWKTGPNKYLPLNGKSDAVALGTAIDAFVQKLFQIEALLAQEVAAMTTAELQTFDAKARFQAILDAQ
ncbi:DUF4376 domain-containing protein [Endozoicomonas acroporae]|uniref:DUF4376 domain-containing protein n=1 Tax=Endozoicomonas acroporae TaxID=1701104 RepID=UPI0013D85221|nr:DUF4376 domain-containing protein [Endozoicomonas acroporae]